MPKIKRGIIVVLDSLGIGELPDARKFQDQGSNTLGNISPIEGLRGGLPAGAFYGKMAEVSAGKDTTTGHWEIAGVVTPKPFPTYPNGFPEGVIKRFTEAIGKPVLGNKPASGTEIIKELGEEHVRTGYPIVYTSADSVFQIAACESVIPVEELYRMCRIARDLLVGRHNVARVIARPFVVDGDKYVRTERRKDFSLPPPRPPPLRLFLGAGA